MITVQPVVYTSLRDLLPCLMQATTSRKGSWREIPIKDPLVQHAAWAYLQPMMTAREVDDRSSSVRLKSKCCRLLECFGEFFDDVVVPTIKGWFSNGGTESEDGSGGR
ncbi:unnamed protein product [Ilex paraguariensis]